MNTKSLLILASVALVAAGCATPTPGPDYDRTYQRMDGPWWETSGLDSPSHQAVETATLPLVPTQSGG